jgi:anti-anti-sigma factor
VSIDQPPATRVERHDAVSSVAVRGEIDIVKAHDLRAQLTGAVRNEDLGLVIDLSETSYIDSVGVSLLFEIAERLAERQLRMAVVLPEAGLVTRVLNIVGLKAVAEVHATADEAVSAISGR